MPLIKIAGFVDRILAIKKAVNERTLNEEQVHELLSKLENQYDLAPKFNDIRGQKERGLFGKMMAKGDNTPEKNGLSAVQKSHYMPSFFGKSQGTVNAYPLEDLILHEMGHAYDQKQNPGIFAGNMALQIATPLAITAGGVAAPLIVEEEGGNEDQKKLFTWAAGIGGGAAGVGVGKLKGALEDRANEFVKSHWAQELGSAEEAQRMFDESILPHGRSSYGYLGPLYKGVRNGIGSAALGYWLSKKLHEYNQRKAGGSDAKQ